MACANCDLAHLPHLCRADLVEAVLLDLSARVGGNCADGTEQVVARQDADDGAVLHNRCARDAVTAQELRDCFEVILDIDANH